MIPLREIKEKARGNGVPETAIERDYVQNWLLKFLSTMDMVLKGGTGIKKVYIGDYRFSDDLDFTLLRKTEMEDLRTMILQSVKNTKEVSGIDFDDNITFEENLNGYEGNIYFRILRKAGNPLRIKLDVTKPDKEKLLLPIRKGDIIHPYSDNCSANILVYSLEEIVAEKIRALFERVRPRDLYDVWYLWDEIDKEKILNIFPEKCRHRGVKTNIQSLKNRKDDFASAWESSLSHQLKKIPNFNSTFDKVIKILCW